MSPEAIQFARSAQGAGHDDSQLDRAGETILQLLNKAADVSEENSRHWRRGSRISCVRPKIGWRSWRQRSPPIRREPSERSSGSIAFTRRSKIDFCGRGMTVAARRNAHRAQNGVPINWSCFGSLRDSSGIAILPGRRAEWP